MTRAIDTSPEPSTEEKYIFHLYVAGATVRSRQALRRVYQLCEEQMKGNYNLDVIDVFQHPELAQKNQIVATPTLVREYPRPVQRFIGILSDTVGLLGELSVLPQPKIAP